MNRPLLDRWTDTTVFRCVLLLSAFAVLPVLLSGVTATSFGVAALLAGGFGSGLGPASVAVALPSIGGVLGFLGYYRAHSGVTNPRGHNFTVTLAFLTAGVVAALVVAGLVLFTSAAGWIEAFRPDFWLIVLGASFAAANLVWALSGIAWMQRLLRRHAEATGQAFDGLPLVLLFIALALAAAVTLRTATL